MPHVSKEKLNKQTSRKIESFLIQLLKKSAKGNKSAVILNALFTETEKIMLAKRLFIIFLLLNDESAYQVWNSLKVSPSTVSRYRQKINQGEFSDLEEYLPVKSGNRYKNNNYNNAFFELLFDFLTSGKNTKRLHQIIDKYNRS